MCPPTVIQELISDIGLMNLNYCPLYGKLGQMALIAKLNDGLTITAKI
jgi:hypothetical protein